MQTLSLSLPTDAAIAAAIQIIRSGGSCTLGDEAIRQRLIPVDGIRREIALGWLTRPGARLVVTGMRARALGLTVHSGSSVSLELPAGTGPEQLAALAGLAGTRSGRPAAGGLRAAPASLIERAGIRLAKRAALLPAMLCRNEAEAPGEAGMTLEAASLLAPQRLHLHQIVETRLPIAATERGRLVLFRTETGEADPLALIVGTPRAEDAPLVRLHSECLTGDLFGSLRCDCGQQLNGALDRMAEVGAGVLLYLRQEGRGIGLANKLRAYRLQDDGLDTVDANTHLGFAPDERDFASAAAMLKILGLPRIRLLTNNPEKLKALAAHGIDVVERVPLSFAANRFNRSYLETKAARSGHLLPAATNDLGVTLRGRLAAAEPPWA
jgi:GTP cyclohydrolase II